jgi:hypothetical protein
MNLQSPTHARPISTDARFAGFWFAVIIATLMYVNAARTLVDPVGFATYMGLPLQVAADMAWVRIFGLRALFIGLTVTFLIVRRDAATLKWLAAFGALIAVGDAALVLDSGGSTAWRHFSIGTFLIIASAAQHRWDRALGKA